MSVIYCWEHPWLGPTKSFSKSNNNIRIGPKHSIYLPSVLATESTPNIGTFAQVSWIFRCWTDGLGLSWQAVKEQPDKYSDGIAMALACWTASHHVNHIQANLPRFTHNKNIEGIFGLFAFQSPKDLIDFSELSEAGHSAPFWQSGAQSLSVEGRQTSSVLLPECPCMQSTSQNW